MRTRSGQWNCGKWFSRFWIERSLRMGPENSIRKSLHRCDHLPRWTFDDRIRQVYPPSLSVHTYLVELYVERTLHVADAPFRSYIVIGLSTADTFSPRDVRKSRTAFAS